MAKYVSAEQNLLSTLKGVVERLNAEPGIVKGGLFHSLPGAMNERVAFTGILNIPEFILLMQELGLIRHRGGGRAVTWEVICVTFVEEVATTPWLERAQASLARRKETIESLRIARVRIAELEARGESSGAGSKALEEIAGMALDLENARAALAKKDDEIAALERKLAEQVSIDPDAALAAAIKRLRSERS